MFKMIPIKIYNQNDTSSSYTQNTTHHFLSLSLTLAHACGWCGMDGCKLNGWMQIKFHCGKLGAFNKRQLNQVVSF